jgi:hypothetical protein
MNLLVPFSDTQKYPYDANYIMFVAILRLQGAAPFFCVLVSWARTPLLIMENY